MTYMISECGRKLEPKSGQILSGKNAPLSSCPILLKNFNMAECRLCLVLDGVRRIRRMR